MPIIKSATKKMKQDQRRYAQNIRTKRAMRAAIKAFEAEPTFDTLREARARSIQPPRNTSSVVRALPVR